MENKRFNVIPSKTMNLNIYSNKNQEKPVRNITLNMSRGASCFNGRSEILENIRLHFKSHENKMVVIHGAPGFGKTETARQFAINNSDYYNGNIIWIFAETQDTIKSRFYRLARILKLKTLDLPQIYGKFNSTRCLLIFDNVENMTSIREYLPECHLHPTVDILITSQFSQWDPSVHKVALEPLSLKASLQIFEAKLGDKYRKNKVEIWEELVKYLEGIPLTLQIVSSLTKYEFSQVHLTKFSLEEFINDFRVQFINSKISESETDLYNKTVLASIRFILEHLKREDMCHALEVLGYIAYLDADFICPNSLLLLPSIGKSKKKLERALTQLVNYSLIQVEYDEINRLKIKIDRIIQFILRKYDLYEQDGSMFKTALKTALSDTWWDICESIFQNVSDKGFHNKLLEFCHENKNSVNALLLKLAFHHCAVLQELLPKIMKEYCLTEQIINDILKMAIDGFNKEDIFTIQLLIENCGAKIEISNNKTNAFHLASSWRLTELFDFLLESSDHKNIINSKDSRGNTTLNRLVEFCNRYSVKDTIKCIDHLIFKWNADISIRGENNNTILHTACWSRDANIELIRYLIEDQKCKDLINIQNNQRQTPLQLFCTYLEDQYFETFEIVSYLLEDCKADITVANYSGWNTLFYICSYGTLEIIDFVLREIECREFINNQDTDGNVAFTMLIRNRLIKDEQDKIKLIKLFIKNTTDFKIRNNENKTLVDIAIEQSLYKLSIELEKY